MSLHGEALTTYSLYETLGHRANQSGDFATGFDYFDRMERLAIEEDDQQARLNALNPGAKAAWLQGEYLTAQHMLLTAYDIAQEARLADEAAIARSNLGRTAMHRIVNHFALDEQANAIRDIALPHFTNAYHGLLGHDHLYYRYANAQHGSVAAALAGDRALAVDLIDEGRNVAFKVSKHYDQVPTYKINPGGLLQMMVAGVLASGGHRSEQLMATTRRKLVR